MVATAACIEQLLNLTSLARDVGISAPTTERWLSILVASNIIYLLQPYSNNILKRVVKTPKLYFLDTGLVAYLTKWPTPEVMKNGAMTGAFFENFIISEIIKSYYNQGITEPPLYFYRDAVYSPTYVCDPDIFHILLYLRPSIGIIYAIFLVSQAAFLHKILSCDTWAQILGLFHGWQTLQYLTRSEFFCLLHRLSLF